MDDQFAVVLENDQPSVRVLNSAHPSVDIKS